MSQAPMPKCDLDNYITSAWVNLLHIRSVETKQQNMGGGGGGRGGGVGGGGGRSTSLQKHLGHYS